MPSPPSLTTRVEYTLSSPLPSSGLSVCRDLRTLLFQIYVVQGIPEMVD